MSSRESTSSRTQRRTSIPNCLRVAVALAVFPILVSCDLLSKEAEQDVVYKTLSMTSDKKQLWSALTRAEELAQWWNKGVKLEPSVGGPFYEPWGKGQLATGKVLAVEPEKSIRFTWQEKSWKPGQQTVCEFSIEENGNIVLLKVRHSGWEKFPESKKQMMEGFSKGWDLFLAKLKSYIEKK